MENVTLKGLVHLRILLHHGDGIADLIVAAQELQQLHRGSVIRVSLQNIGLVDGALDPLKLGHLPGKGGIHEHAQHPVQAADAVEHIAVFGVGIQDALGIADVQEHIQVDLFGGALHVGAELELGAELVIHGLEQGIVTDLHEVVGHLKGGENQAVFVEAQAFLPVLLHDAAGPDTAGFLVVVFHHARVAGQVANHILAGFFGVGHIHDQLILFDLLAGQVDDVLKALEGLLHRIHPGRVNGLHFLAVGKLDLVVGLGHCVHEKLIELIASQGAQDTAGELVIDLVHREGPVLLFRCLRHKARPPCLV